MVEFVLNSSINASTGFTPFELTYRYMPCALLSFPDSQYGGVLNFANQALDNLSIAHDTLIVSQVGQTTQANKCRRPDSECLVVGNLAYLSTKDLNLPSGRA